MWIIGELAWRFWLPMLMMIWLAGDQVNGYLNIFISQSEVMKLMGELFVCGISTKVLYAAFVNLLLLKLLITYLRFEMLN